MGAGFPVPTSTWRFVYRDIDITPQLLGVTTEVTFIEYNTLQSPDLEIKIADYDRRWEFSWYPIPGDTLDVTITFNGIARPVGPFVIDEVEISGPPDLLVIRALGTPMVTPFRTSDSNPTDATLATYEDVPTETIVNAIAAKHGMVVSYHVSAAEAARLGTSFHRTTQNCETDLKFLSRLAVERGFLFYVMNGTIYFLGKGYVDGLTSTLLLERGLNLIKFKILDHTFGSFVDTETRTYSLESKSGISAVANGPPPGAPVAGALGSPVATSADHQHLTPNVNSTDEAEALAAGGQRAVNDDLIHGSFTIEGYPPLTTNVVVTWHGFGALDGDYRMIQVTHKINRADGYLTLGECQKIVTFPDPTPGADPVVEDASY